MSYLKITLFTICATLAMAIAPLGPDLSPGSTAPEGSLSAAYLNLVDGRPSKMTVILLARGDKRECRGEGPCAKITTFQDNGKASRVKTETRTLTKAEVNPRSVETGTVWLGGKLSPARYSPATHTLYLFRANPKLMLRHFSKVRFTGKSPVRVGDPTPQVIPPFIWDWLTGTEGQCCTDCYAVHRNWNLPCSADNACCAGTCGVQPGCNGGVVPIPPDEDNCSGDREVSGAEVEVNGITCDYTGTLSKTTSDMGECVEFANGGVFSNCREAGSPKTPDNAPLETLSEW
ncbi:MAG: hypothetical protein WA952_13015 [Lewinella sp.]